MRSQTLDDISEILACPRCRGRLELGSELRCLNSECGRTFPVVREVPILIDEEKSIASLNDYIRTPSIPAPRSRRLLRRVLSALTPSPSLNIRSTRNYRRLTSLLEEFEAPRVLVVGGRVEGKGSQELLNSPTVLAVETDIQLGPRTQIVCDCHCLPFREGSFQGAVAQAVLEHVVDAEQCVAEIRRVLTPNGLIYVETPFMQQVHASPYDFRRWTYLGLRRLLRHFDEIDVGPLAGPGTALAWAWVHFWTTFPRSPYDKAVARIGASLTGCWIKYLDWFLLDRRGSWDAASAYYFLGRKTDQPLTDRELVSLYR